MSIDPAPLRPPLPGDSPADLVDAALAREAAALARTQELERALEAQRFLAQSSEALALSLDDRTTLRVLAGLLVPRCADWCIVDSATREGAPFRSVVVHASGEDSDLVPWLESTPPPLGAIGVHSRECLLGNVSNAPSQGELASLPSLASLAGGLPPDLVPVAEAIEARSAIVVYALGASDRASRIALFTARSKRKLGFDDFSLAEELARRTAQALERAFLYGEARRSNEAKDAFLAAASHELRGPLAAISMWTHALGIKTCDEATRVRALQAIEESVRAQGRLIEDMIDLARLVAGKLPLEVAPLKVAHVVRSAISGALPMASAKGVALVYAGEEDATLDGDEPRLLRVFGNLISNAIEFTAAGGKVEVSVSAAPTEVRVTVRDDGEGISGSFLPEVFQPFREEDDPTLTISRGGLGLAVARRIAELHGGTIHAESAGRGEGGATFRVELPRKPGPKVLGSDR